MQVTAEEISACCIGVIVIAILLVLGVVVVVRLRNSTRRNSM